MDYRHICSAAMLAQHGLQTAHNAANNVGFDKEGLDAAIEAHSLRQILFRYIMLEIANVADVAGISRTLYKDHPELATMHSELSKAFEFFKYIRNKYVGHLVPDLTAKTFEWQPHAYTTLGKEESGQPLLLSWWVLETVINTYTDPSSGHKIFEGETDLNYPPDQDRFLNFLGETVVKSLKYTTRLIEVTVEKVEIPDLENDWVQLAIKAGKTEFEYLAKKR
ncbi:hypothetical protein [Parasedimentitalea huanghaiensis]|uniref:Uncharacterized protein n=1 Tax=Parasedimentitalea huanghaiensis TaxID=2682100 RepID=A0A6L6WKJ3_9RHOB|nr:hypothetical protein [Zongyanglinia huanghaiensis]MVO18363.1 hypothetical protein [Zongyanglinia huanghaiensis]